MHEPRMVHWKATLHVLTYIKGTPEKDLIYQKHEHIKIEVYSDSSYARDKEDRKSTSSYCAYIKGESWRSKK